MKSGRRGNPQKLCILGCMAASVLGQDASKALPHNYERVFANSFVEVLKVRYEPGEKVPVHNHSDAPTVYVYLTDSGRVRFHHLEGHEFTNTRQPVKAGYFRVSPGRIERHEVQNLGNIPSEFLRIELRQFRLGESDLQFRPKKSFDLTKTQTTAEFSIPHLSIQRMVLAAAGDTQGVLAANPGLLVALSPVVIRGANNSTRLLENGDVYWENANDSLKIEKTPNAPAHLLLLTFM